MSISFYSGTIIVANIILCLSSMVFSVHNIDTLIRLEIRENIPMGTVICELSNRIIPRPVRNTDFTITKNKFFSIEGNDKLVISGFIDRDDNAKLCAYKTSNQTCIWKSFLFSSTGFYHILEIYVSDENDNIPHWTPSIVFVNVTENTPIASFQQELPRATDSDEFPNNVIHYKIEPPSKYFAILLMTSQMGLKPILKLKRLVDRELVSWHNITLLAIDGGTPSRTGSLFLFIKILDVNDNNPVFESSIYTRSLDNNLEVNTTLNLNIHATDLDVNSNGRITYRLSMNAPFIIQSCFEINPISAIIKIRKPLTHSCYSPEYRFNITAADDGHPRKTATTSVVLFLKNQNLHPPKIMLSKSDPNIDLFENNDVGISLISGAVTDKDSERNGEFHCELQGIASNELVLKTNKTRIGDVTLISLFANTVFDREQISKIHVSIVCRDFGEPPLQSHENITITILDVNDNAPIFERQYYYLKIYEENQPNFKIAQPAAYDRDSGKNALLNYRIKWDLSKYNLNGLIDVDSQCQITTKQPLDREIYTNGFQFQIVATDQGKPQRSGFTTVYIDLMDINDHSPVFERPFYNLSFTEDFGSQQKRRVVGFIVAHDVDLRENGEITYSLSSEKLLPFKLQATTGELYSYNLVDRESQPTHYSLSVIATDNPSNLLYRKTSSVSISIAIEDVNDNVPKFIFPNEQDHKVQLSFLVPVGTVVTTVRASDKDAGSNSKIKFSLVDPDRNILFSLNESSGEVATSTVLSTVHEGIEILFIRASDCGSPPSSTIQKLTVDIGEYRSTESANVIDGDVYSESFLSDQATFIIVGIVLGTFFVCCGLVTGICTMAYRRWHRSHDRSTTTQLYQVGEEQTNVQYIDNYLIMKEIA